MAMEWEAALSWGRMLPAMVLLWLEFPSWAVVLALAGLVYLLSGWLFCWSASVLQADSFKDHSLSSNQNHLGFSENKNQTLAKDAYVLFSLVYLTTALYREPCVENAYSCFFSLILRCVQGISFLFVPLISHFLCEITSTTYDASVLCACPYWCFFGLKCWILSLQDSVQLPWTLVEVNRRKIGFTRAGLTPWVGKSVH